MSIFTKSDGSVPEKSTSYEQKGFTVMPEGTEALCNVLSCTIKPLSERDSKAAERGDSYLAVTWVVVAGEYKNVAVDQKIFVYAPSSKTLDNAIDVLSVLDTISGGKLAAVSKKAASLDDLTAQHFSRAFNGLGATVKFGRWEMEGNDGVTREGNFVRGVSAPSKKVQQEDNAVISREPGSDDDFGDIDDIAF